MECLIIKTTDSTGRSRFYGTNTGMLERDLQVFSRCDLSRYPEGKMKGFRNGVELIRTNPHEVLETGEIRNIGLIEGYLPYELATARVISRISSHS